MTHTLDVIRQAGGWTLFRAGTAMLACAAQLLSEATPLGIVLHDLADRLRHVPRIAAAPV